MQIRILVVDDEQDICDYLKLVLSKEGYEVTTCTDPALVLDLLKQSQFHLVILDMHMPGPGGLLENFGTSLLEDIRRQDTDLAVVVATAYPKVDTAVASLRAHASNYVQKPFETAEFLKMVREALAQKGLSTDPEAKLHREIGRVIREARTGAELTLKQLARRTALSVSLLSQIERAESSASISSLYKIASALGLRMSELFAEAEGGGARRDTAVDPERRRAP